MALSAQLGGAGMTASRLETTATVSLEKVGDSFVITKSHLDLVAKIPGADKAKFDAAVKAAETGCPVSKLFKAEISVTARLESQKTTRFHGEFSFKRPNRYNAAHDSSSRGVRRGCGDLCDRGVGCIRGYHPAAARHAEVSSGAAFLPFALERLEIRDLLHPQPQHAGSHAGCLWPAVAPRSCRGLGRWPRAWLWPDAVWRGVRGGDIERPTKFPYGYLSERHDLFHAGPG